MCYKTRAPAAHRCPYCPSPQGRVRAPSGNPLALFPDLSSLQLVLPRPLTPAQKQELREKLAFLRDGVPLLASLPGAAGRRAMLIVLDALLTLLHRLQRAGVLRPRVPQPDARASDSLLQNSPSSPLSEPSKQKIESPSVRPEPRVTSERSRREGRPHPVIHGRRGNPLRLPSKIRALGSVHPQPSRREWVRLDARRRDLMPRDSSRGRVGTRPYRLQWPVPRRPTPAPSRPRALQPKGRVRRLFLHNLILSTPTRREIKPRHLSRAKMISHIGTMSDAKPYHIRQLLRAVERYNLKLEDEQ